MKKKFFTILILATLLATPVAGLAIDTLETYDVVDTLENIVNWIFTIVMIVAVIYLMFGGVAYITSEGDATKLEKAKKQILFALFGTGIVLLANGLKKLIEDMMA
ncbi:MAG: pilin [Patescibacteria group bacterium]|nr:pilin [Patescibacteria group bacterium]